MRISLHAPADMDGRALAGALAEILAKAVAAHPSHAQARTREGRFKRYSWRSRSPRDASGRFVARLTGEERAAAQAMALRTQQAFERRLTWHWTDVAEDRLTAQEATARGREEIGQYYEAMYRTGLQAAGNPGLVLEPHERALIQRLVDDEVDFWEGFMGDVAAERGRVPYPARCAMYGNAARQLHWLGFALGNHAPSRRINWVLGPTDHCETCKAMADGSPWTVAAFLKEAAKGYLPQGGDLKCHGIKCKCSLSETFLKRNKGGKRA